MASSYQSGVNVRLYVAWRIPGELHPCMARVRLANIFWSIFQQPYQIAFADLVSLPSF